MSAQPLFLSLHTLSLICSILVSDRCGHPPQQPPIGGCCRGWPNSGEWFKKYWGIQHFFYDMSQFVKSKKKFLASSATSFKAKSYHTSTDQPILTILQKVNQTPKNISKLQNVYLRQTFSNTELKLNRSNSTNIVLDPIMLHGK